MKLLIVCSEYPSPSNANSFRVLRSLKYLSGKFGHDITLLGFKIREKEYPDLSGYGRVETVNLDVFPGLESPKAILYALKNILSGHLSPRNFAYSPEMDRKITALLDKSRYDVLIIDHPSMLRYTANRGVPIVLMEAVALAEIYRMYYKFERNWLIKIIHLLYYYQFKNYAREYRAASVSVAVSAKQREMVLSHCADLDIEVIPTGMEIDPSGSPEPETELPSLIITGQMGGGRNVEATLYFYKKIYPLIKASIPRIKLYIVGRNPGKEIRDLASDESVVVTGYVPDVRPFLSSAWGVIAPLIEGFGIKSRILEAMAAGKPVVSTSMVTDGIDVTPGEDIIIADEPAEFAERVIELLNDRRLREKIGANAKRLMETDYSWDKLSDKVNEVLKRAAQKSPAPKPAGKQRGPV